MKRHLDILIPTYNRVEYLIANLFQVSEFITSVNLDKIVGIIISDNASNDETEVKVRKFINENLNPLLKIFYHRNQENIGLKNNILNVLSLADAQYIIFLGDDDFISKEYWEFIFSGYIEKNNISLIIPVRSTRKPPFDYTIPYITNEKVKWINYKSSNSSTVKLSAQCNQLSGILYLNNNLYQRARSCFLDNLYPFMAFAGWSLENGTGLKLVNNFIRVTEGVKKDWAYGNNGLLIDIIDNVKHFSFGFKRLVNEAMYIWIWKDRIEMNVVIGNGIVKRGLFEIFKSSRILFSTKLIYALFLLYSYLKVFVYKITGRLVSPHNKMQTS